MGSEALLRKLKAQPNAVGNALRPSVAVPSRLGRGGDAVAPTSERLGSAETGRVVA